MNKLTREEEIALSKLAEAEKSFLKCVDLIADGVSKKDSFYFAALSSLCGFLIRRLSEDEMHALSRVYAHLMKLKKEGIDNERFN